MIRDNLIYKLVALAVALGLWMYVNSERNPSSRKNVSVALNVQNAPVGFVVEPRSKEVSVSIEGPKSAVDSVRKEDITAFVDLEGFTTSRQSAEKEFKVTAGVSGASGSGLTYTVNPTHVKVTIEPLGGKKMPVEVKFLSAPPIGKSYSNPVLTPASVSVSGTSAVVRRVRRVVLTVPGDVPNSGIDTEFTLTPMDDAGTEVLGVTLDPQKVQMKLNLIEVKSKKQVIVSAALQGAPKYPNKVTGVSVIPSVVTLDGLPKALEKISTVTTEPVSVEGAEGDVVKEVRLIVPSGCQLEGSGQVRVNVVIGGGQ